MFCFFCVDPLHISKMDDFFRIMMLNSMDSDVNLFKSHFEMHDLKTFVAKIWKAFLKRQQEKEKRIEFKRN